jgi:DNA-binding GntR family transcriptional regulator
MISKLRFQTKTAAVEDALRNEILNGTLPPGSGLLQEEIAARLGVSPTPVREAFGQLEAEGLVERRPHKGVVVAVARQLDPLEAELIYRMRHLMEDAAYRRLASGKEPEVLSELGQINADAELARHSGDFVTYRQLMSRFHRTLARGSGSAILTGLAHQLISHSQFFVTSLTNDGLRRAHRNHRDVVAALSEGNAQLALDIALRHLQDNLSGLKTPEGADRTRE